jgi:probable phosphoglycerate mutase
MKHIYFIRHGETLKNRGRVHQGPEEPLTERGREQVRQVIAYLEEQQIDTLVSSNYLRAQQTAEMIGEVLGLPFAIEPSVREFGRPLPLYGRHHYSLASFRYLVDLYRHRLDLLWDDNGAENLAHIRERVRDARLTLEALPGERIAVVSHRIFMSMFTETVCYDKPLSLLKFTLAMMSTRRIPNTGVLHFTCESEAENVRNWSLVETVMPTYNR